MGNFIVRGFGPAVRRGVFWNLGFITTSSNPTPRYLLYRVLEPLKPYIVGTWRVREIYAAIDLFIYGQSHVDMACTRYSCMLPHALRLNCASLRRLAFQSFGPWA